MVKPKYQQDYEAICNEYIQIFSKKQGYEFSFWVADIIGDIACFIDEYYFSFSDIAYDVNAKCPKGSIFKWHDHLVKMGGEERSINYYSYLKGLRIKKKTNKQQTSKTK